MKCFAAALLMLLLAGAALGIPAPVTQGPTTMSTLEAEPEIYVFHEDFGCCLSKYKNFVCSRMKDYYKSSKACPHRGIVFITKDNRMTCADVRNKKVLLCIKSLVLKYKLA